MKRFISLLICICMLITVLPVSADENEYYYIELDSLQYDEYMRGETIFISGSTNTFVTLGLYYPEDVGGTLKYSMIYSPSELSDGIELLIGESDDWFYGEWTIIVQWGDISESLSFTLSEYVDRTEEPSDEKTESSSKNPSSSNKDTSSVVTISPEKTNVTITAGETEKINITTSASSLSLEIEDKDVVSASLSGKTLTVTGIKKGTSTIWVKTSNNYANINVTVVSPSITEEATEPATEEATEPVTEEATEPTTEDVTENDTEATVENPFTDLPDTHWAKESILSLYKKGIINGMTETTFAPDEYVTRAQFVTMLCNAFDLKLTSSKSPFNDVSENDWFFKSVMAAYNNSITQGDPNGNFNPNNLVTRQDMAVLSYRAALNNSIPLMVTSINLFADHDMISDYAVESVYAMKSSGIINGMTETTFEPKGNATRAQAAHIIAKLLEV